MTITKGYKAFDADMTYRGKQYAENTTFVEGEAEICKKGMHFCANPLDCLDYYPLIDSEGNKVLMAEVEGEDAITDDGEKYVTKTLHIKNLISIEDAIRKYANDAKDSEEWKGASIGGYNAKSIGGDYAKSIGGNYAQSIGGYNAQSIGGDYAQSIGGDYAKSIGGKNSVAVCGYNSVITLGLHSIALGYIFRKGIQQPPVTLYIDGETYKADTAYRFNGEKWEEVK